MKLSTPVVLTIFNRPETTARVFREITQAEPATLLIVADGPRPNVAADKEQCRKAREITEKVEWECTVIRNYSDENMGCKSRMASGLDWVFSTVEEAIILEDDCLPSQSFFGYCQELLEYYRNDTRIMQICGFNALEKWTRNGHSYYFSNYGPIWGWASWRRAWRHYDVDLKLWPDIREKGIYKDLFLNCAEVMYRLDLYDKVYSGSIDTWDYQWGFAKIINHGLSVIPALNLIANIGFCANATHTPADQNNPYSNMSTYELDQQLYHPQYIVRDYLADKRYVSEFMGIKSEKSKFAQLLDRVIPRDVAR